MVRDRNSRGDAPRGRFAVSVAGVLAMLAAPLLGGCVTEAQHRRGEATIAFESIDGPPRAVFDRLVAQLDAEAQARQIAVVSRQAPARYRVRAYLAAKIEPRGTAIAWVWDVYDADLQRATRIGGEEQAGRLSRDAWSAADDRVLGRIAEAGMRQLAAFAAGEAPAGDRPPAPEMAPSEPVVPPPVPASDVQVAAVASSTAVSGYPTH